MLARTKRALFLFVAMGTFLGLCTACVDRNEMPRNADYAFSNPTRVTIYSLSPDRKIPAKEDFQGFKILGQADLSGEQAEQAVAAFKSAATAWDSSLGIANCFEPRHGLRIYAGNKVYDFVLCFSCQQMFVFEDDAFIAGLGAYGSPDSLNTLLKELNIPLSKL